MKQISQVIPCLTPYQKFAVFYLILGLHVRYRLRLMGEYISCLLNPAKRATISPNTSPLHQNRI